MRLLTLFCLIAAASSCAAETLVYFGTYTRGQSNSRGIYVAELDEQSGRLSEPRLAVETPNPSFVAIAPDGRTLFAASEGGGGDEPVGIVAFSINADGTLKRLNGRSSGGRGACHVAVDPNGRAVGVANYSGGSCALFPIKTDGSLGPIGSFHQHSGHSVDARRQSGPHAHSINFNSDGSQAFVADLGLDKILIYDLDPNAGTMTAAEQPFLKLPAGTGPRHFCFVPGAKAAITNLEMSSQVAMLNYDAEKGALSLNQIVSSLPENTDVTGNSTAECLAHPNGRFAYVSNRGHNSIAIFRIDAKKGTITPIGHESTGGEVPRGFGIHPDGKFLIAGNQRSGNVVTFRIDPKSGLLSRVGHEIKIDSPVNVRFLLR